MKPQLPDQFSLGAPLLQESALQDAPAQEIVELPEYLASEVQSKKSESPAEILDLIEKWIPESSYTNFVSEPTTGKLLKVIDIEKIKELLLPDRYDTGSNRVSRKKILYALFEKHKNDVVLSPEQVDTGEYEPKPLFYYPKSVADATDVIALADTDFHIPLWDMAQKMVLAERSNIYPTQSGEDFSMFEARSAIMLFHPKYGDGRRNPKDGKLYLKNPDYSPVDPNSQKRDKFSRDCLRKFGVIINKTGTGESRSMRDGLTEDCPNLLLSGALQLEDVREVTLTREGQAINQFEKTVGTNAYIMLRGVNQYVGKRFAGCSVSAFGNNQALLIDESDGYKKIRAIFTIVDKSNASEVYIGSNGNQIPRANADKTNVIEIKYEKLVPLGFEGKSDVLVIQKRKEVAMHIAQSVESLMSIAKESEDLVRSEIQTIENELQALVEQVRSSLLKQAERAIALTASLPDLQTLEATLRASETSARVFVALMQSVGVEKMLKEPLDTVPANELNSAERDQMRHLLQVNYEAAYPGEEQMEFRKEITESLESSFTREGTNFYLLKDGDKIVSFNRFDTAIDATNGRIVMYFGSFNADPKYRGVGGMMLEHTIQEKLSECDVMQAHCDPQSDISKKYIEDGFIATNTITVAGKSSFEIWRSQESGDRLVTKSKTILELLAISDKPHRPADSFFVRTVTPRDTFPELDKDLGYALTRYFTVKGVTYAVFEIPPADLYNQFTPVKH